MSVAELRANLLALDKERKRIESDISAARTQLDALGVGMHAPLIDKEGFPRADVDLYQVRSLRQRVTMLLNDNKEKQKEIEESLTKLHALGPAALVPEKPTFPSSASAAAGAAKKPSNEGAGSSAAPVLSVSPPVGSLFRPFALIDDVSPDSPASMAGLKAGDKIAGIGTLVSLSSASSATSSPLPSLSDLATVVRSNVGLPLPVIIQRGDDAGFLQLTLTPQPWSGQGVLGCHVVLLPDL
jgi:26S proteasome regulatory subunit N4